ncbi:hypothetical protein [Desulfonema magnum]|uniref:hypothetical protein n=1 Tax=Desulfonema magnum TaxID=45655 RepID=UPI001A9B00FF|nr:hypothetical protein [Desulfonema magnum]
MCSTFYTSEKISHKDTKEPLKDFVRLRAFVAKNGCVPPFTHPKKSATKPQRHKGTTERLRETLCLRAFVAKNGCVPPFTHPKKSATKTQRHKGTTKRLRETLCLRGKKTDVCRLSHIKPVLV